MGCFYFGNERQNSAASSQSSVGKKGQDALSQINRASYKSILTFGTCISQEHLSYSQCLKTEATTHLVHFVAIPIKETTFTSAVVVKDQFLVADTRQCAEHSWGDVVSVLDSVFVCVWEREKGR